MKKLNRKGFTLIELLAIIVILAIIMIVTIPTVLTSLTQAKQGAFDSAVKSIEKYVQNQYDLCAIGDASIAGTHDTSVITSSGASCGLVATNPGSAAVTAAGYKTADITIADTNISITSGKVKISSATGTANGQFAGLTYSGS